MVASAVFVMDSKGKIIISRNYRGDVPSSASIRYVPFVFDVSAIFYSLSQTLIHTICVNIYINDRWLKDIYMYFTYLKSLSIFLSNLIQCAWL